LRGFRLRAGHSLTKWASRNVARQVVNQGDHQWVELEEVPGPDPNPPEPFRYRGGRPIPSGLDVVSVAAYREQERP
jgi:hypothetical protein